MDSPDSYSTAQISPISNDLWLIIRHKDTIQRLMREETNVSFGMEAAGDKCAARCAVRGVQRDRWAVSPGSMLLFIDPPSAALAA